MKDGYRDWLAANYAPATVNTQLSQARRLEREFGDLDEHFNHDRFTSLLAKLKYTAADERAGKPSPTELTAGATKIAAGLAHLRGALGFYRRFREGVSRDNGWSAALEQMRKRFLARCHDFKDFKEESGVYFDVERNYKNVVLEKFEQLLKTADKLDDRTLGDQALAQLQEKPANFLSWRDIDAIAKAGEDGAREIAVAIGEMLHSDNAPDGLVAHAAARIEPHFPPRSFANIRSLVSAPLAFARPDEAMFIKTRIMQRAIRELTGEPLFRQQSIDAEEYGAFLGLMRRIEGVMRDEWNWEPKDLWDVQGFLWVVMADDWQDENDASDGADGMNSTGNPPPQQSAYPLNQILYGPPGTGKTWTTARIAVAICNGTAPQSRQDLMAEYERLRATGRIALTTFHQSLGYEEFVEGLRPMTDSDVEGAAAGGFRLEPQNGIFREICALAEQARPMGPEEGTDDLERRAPQWAQSGTLT